MGVFLKKLNILGECKSLQLPIVHCPPFLMILLGFITITAMVGTYLLATRYTEEPEVAALIVIFVTIVFIVVGDFIMSGFRRIAEVNRLKSEFIFIVTHQLRSPLSIIKWSSEAIERELKKNGGGVAVNSFMQTIQDTIANMSLLINSILEINKIEAHTLIFKREPFSLIDLSQDVIDSYAGLAGASNVKLTLSTASALPEVIGDRGRVAMAIQNLLDNAIRYTKGGGEVTITIEPRKSELYWAIKDAGLGIPEAHQKLIFQRFFRASNVSQEDFHGSGIGLYISKLIIEGLGGKIGFQSKEEKGSTFWFTLPLSKK